MGLAEEIDPNEPERLVEIDDDKPLQLQSLVIPMLVKHFDQPLGWRRSYANGPRSGDHA